MTTLTVLMGPPGAGKTTWVERNPDPHRVLCSTERLRTDRDLSSRQGAMVAFLAGLRRKAERALRDGHDVLIDGCNTRKGDRTGWLRIARERGASPHLVVFHAPLPLLLQVQQERGSAGVPEHKVRQYHMECMRALPVIHAEGWASITHVRRGVYTHAQGGRAISVPPTSGDSAQHKRISKW